MPQAENLPTGFVDIHCHILPGIDDGPEDWDQALGMARAAVRDGVEWLVATPHQGGRYSHNSAEAIRQLCLEAQQHLNEHQVPLRLFYGADVRIEETLPEALAQGAVLKIANKRYVLMELPHDVHFPLDGLLKRLRPTGTVPILTHPERNSALRRQRHVIGQFIQAGGLIQLTAGSLLGAFGGAVRQFSEELLLAGEVHVVASDAHGVCGRPPALGDAYRQIARLAGRDLADILCRRNPARIVQGLPLNQLETIRPRQSFWSRTWRRLAG